MIGHPAKYSKGVLDCFRAHIPNGAWVLDPFAGTGKIHELAQACDVKTFGNELEPEWAQLQPQRTVVGNALALPFCDDAVSVIATSPCYGNRMADHHEAKDPCRHCGGKGSGMDVRGRTCKVCKGTGLSMRKTYRHQLQRPLSKDSAGGLQWGVEYRTFHINAWNEAVRVLCPGGMFLLNVSDHIRKDAVVPVTQWHVEVLRDLLHLELEAKIPIQTQRMRVGANSTKRVECEWVCKFFKDG